MPVKIESFEPLSEEEFIALREQKARKTDPAMAALLAEVQTGQPVRVPLVEEQSARGLRAAISRAASSRGLTGETVEGEGFVAVRKVDEPRTRKGKQASSADGQRRRGRSPKRQEQDAAELASSRNLAAGRIRAFCMTVRSRSAHLSPEQGMCFRPPPVQFPLTPSLSCGRVQL